MKKLFINNRDELVIIDLEQIAYVKADGNYINIAYMGGAKATLSVGLTNFETLIRNTYRERCPFVRLGRSIIINQLFLYDVNVSKQQLSLTNYRQSLTIKMSKRVLKDYKAMIVNSDINKSKKEG